MRLPRSVAQPGVAAFDVGREAFFRLDLGEDSIGDDNAHEAEHFVSAHLDPTRPMLWCDFCWWSTLAPPLESSR